MVFLDVHDHILNEELLELADVEQDPVVQHLVDLRPEGANHRVEDMAEALCIDADLRR